VVSLDEDRIFFRTPWPVDERVHEVVFVTITALSRRSTRHKTGDAVPAPRAKGSNKGSQFGVFLKGKLAS
jgi:hypothetical protein